MDESYNNVDAWNNVYPKWVQLNDSGKVCQGCTSSNSDWLFLAQFGSVGLLLLWGYVSYLLNLGWIVSCMGGGIIGFIYPILFPTHIPGRTWYLEMQGEYLTMFVECGGHEEYSYTREELYWSHPEIADQIAVEMDRQYDLLLKKGVEA
jgi:hypothetical protein